jgi:hypothetical protein
MNRSKLAAVAAIIFLVALSVLAQSTSIKVDGNIIKSYIATMSDAAHEGRRSLTPGYEKTAEWAAGLFKQWGLKPAGENGTYFQKVPILPKPQNPDSPAPTFAYRLGVPELTIDKRTFYIRDSDFTIDPSSPAGAKVTGEVVFVGYGISAPAKGLDEYPANVKGKIVLAFRGSPKDAPAVGGRMGGAQPPPPTEPVEAWTEESADSFKAKVAYDKGAAGIILYNPPAAPAGRGGAAAAAPVLPPMGGRGGAPADVSPFTRPFLFVSTINDAAFRWIMWRNPQQSLNEFNATVDQMRRDIRDKKVRSISTSLKAVVKGYDSITLYGDKFKNNFSRNVLGKIEGTDPTLKNQYVVLGGHMDHLGVNNGVVMNGADDNASGTAVAMEVGRLLAANKVPLKRTVIIGLWCGEEQGLLGSNYYVQNPTDGVSMDRVVGYFNMDMVGLGDAIGAPGALNFPEIYNIIKRNQDPSIKMSGENMAGPGGSDYSAFIELGIESLALMTSGGVGHPDYHQSGDDTEKIDPKILGQTGQFVLQGVINLANETQANLFIPDRQRIYEAQRLTVTDMRGGPQPAGRGGDAQPAGRGGGASWRNVEASNSGELAKLADDRIKQLLAAQPAAGAAAIAFGGRGGGGGARYSLGVRDSGVFDGSIPSLVQSASLLNFGRVDVASNDGSWFNFNSGVSAQGREAVKAMETNNIALNLINPSAKLLGDMLDVTTKPFLVTVTGTAPIDQAMITRMNQKNTLLLFECDPADAGGCANRLQSYKKQFGDSDNLVISVKRAPTESIDAFKKSFYMALIKSGWTKDEIYAVCGAPVPVSGGGRGTVPGNLSKLSPPPSGGRGGN